MLLGYIQLWDVLLIWMIVGQEPIVRAVGRDGGLFFFCFFFVLPIFISFISPSLWEAA